MHKYAPSLLTTVNLVAAQLTAMLRAPEVMLQPSAGDARLALGRLLRGVVESANAFVRWMDGTCLCCDAPPGGEPMRHRSSAANEHIYKPTTKQP